MRNCHSPLYLPSPCFSHGANCVHVWDFCLARLHTVVAIGVHPITPSPHHLLAARSPRATAGASTSEVAGKCSDLDVGGDHTTWTASLSVSAMLVRGGPASWCGELTARASSSPDGARACVQGQACKGEQRDDGQRVVFLVFLSWCLVPTPPPAPIFE